ncbi:MAG: hypothetical protein ACOCV2_10120, partial [Persicimonas sp.]
NHFLYTIDADAPSFIQPWLGQWWTYELHEIGSVAGPLVARNVIVGLVVVGLTIAAARRARSLRRGVVVGLAAFVIMLPAVDAGPQMFAWPLFAALLAIGDRVRRGESSRWWLVAFPVVAAFWANLAPGFLLVALLCAVFAALSGVAQVRGSRDTGIANLAAWIGALVASLVAPLLNPRGAELYGHVIERISTIEVALLYGALGMDPMGLLVWAGIALPFVAAPLLARSVEDESTAPTASVYRLVGYALLLLLFIAGAWLVQPGTVIHRGVTASFDALDVRTEPPLAGMVPADTPVAQAESLRQYKSGLRVFHDHRYAGFLLYNASRTEPRQMVFVDHRPELPPEDVWELYKAVNETSAWRGVFEQYDVEAAVLHRGHQRRLIGRMKDFDEWRLVDEDEHNALFILEE